MTRKIVVAATALAASLVLAGLGLAAGSAGTTKLTASLNTAQEVPKPNATRGSGRFTGTLTRRSLSWKLRFTKLTGPAAAAHIHLGKRGKAGPVAIPLCGPCKSPAQGKGKVSASLARALKTGGAYVNVHTAMNGDGEIRGQIKIARPSGY